MTIVDGLNIHRKQISFTHPDIVTGEVRRRAPACFVNVPFLSNAVADYVRPAGTFAAGADRRDWAGDRTPACARDRR